MAVWRPTVLLLTIAFLSVSCASRTVTSPICLAGAHLDSRGGCVAQQASDHHIPFRAGESVRVTQAFHGFASHREDLAFAIDFACDEGTPITASRSGVVWSSRRDSHRGCADPSCVDDANYVILDHGDGTYSSYFHLQREGVLVEKGDQVCQGQVIGLCGNTGFSSGPHLHFAVTSSQWTTIPVTFRELNGNPLGVVLPRTIYTSANQRQSRCPATDYSTLGPDAFAHRGILLNHRVDTVLGGDRTRSMVFDGLYTGEMSHIAVHRRPIGGGPWLEHCLPVQEDGRFAFRLYWPEEIFDEGYYFLMLTGSDTSCDAPGWSWSYRIRLD
jgi:hypothetical protein